MSDFIRITLGPAMINCPIYWKNFINMCQEKYNLPTHLDVPVRLIQQELKPYYARYIFEADYINRMPREFIEFQYEKHLSFFILRFS